MERERLADKGADYALLIIFHSNRATGGRQAVAMLAAIGGVAIHTHTLKFRSVLIDLRDGHVKWANFDD